MIYSEAKKYLKNLREYKRIIASLNDTLLSSNLIEYTMPETKDDETCKDEMEKLRQSTKKQIAEYTQELEKTICKINRIRNAKSRFILLEYYINGKRGYEIADTYEISIKQFYCLLKTAINGFCEVTQSQ